MADLPINLEKAEIYRAFDLFKRYADQENNLLNQRITWMLLMQGFLLTMFGAVLTKKDMHVDEIAQGDMQHWPAVCLTILVLGGIAVLGFYVSNLSRNSIEAAVDAQTNLNEIWETKFLATAVKHDLPLLIDGGKKDPKARGSQFGTKLPRSCMIMWVVFPICLGLASLALGAQHAALQQRTAAKSPAYDAVSGKPTPPGR